MNERQDRTRARRADEEVSLVRAAPVLARLAGAAWWRATGWALETSVRAGMRILRGAAQGESPADLLVEAEFELRDYMRRLLGMDDEEKRSNGAPPPATGEELDVVDSEAVELDGHVTGESLRLRGAELLRRSADVDYDDEFHPAYARILGDLAPDEARILRLLARDGPQPAVDVRTAGPLGVVKSDLVAPGLSMIGLEAGCRRIERVHSYLDNLSRLGLIWFSREQLEDLRRYQVLEAQPAVAEAMQSAGRTRTVRRSIHLTSFGEDFCGTCLPLDDAGDARTEPVS